MRLHLIKATRTYTQRGYEGISCDNAGVPRGAEYADLHAALADAVRLCVVNPVGWQVVDAETGETVRMVSTGTVLALQAARDLLAPVLRITSPTPQPSVDDDGTLFVTWLVNGESLDVAVDPAGGWTVWRSGAGGFVDMGTSDEDAPFPATQMLAWLTQMSPQVTEAVPDRLTDLFAAAG
jgi:hypothetical protein